MRKLVVFNHVTLGGYFTTPNGDISFLRKGFQDEEFHSFAVENINAAGASGLHSYWKSSFLKEISYGAIDTMVAYCDQATHPDLPRHYRTSVRGRR